MNAELKPCEKCGGRLALYTRNVGALILCRGCDADWQYDNVIDAVADNLLRPVEDALRAERDAALAEAERYKALLDMNANLNAKLIVDMGRVGLESDALRAKWESVRQALAGIVEHGCVLHTEDGLCCYYCEADAEYPDESGDYEHFELPHTTTCIWAQARAMLADIAMERLRPGPDTVFMTRSEGTAMYEELKALRAFKASVPWNEITLATWKLETWPDSPSVMETHDTLSKWLIANNWQMSAPEEAAE